MEMAARQRREKYTFAKAMETVARSLREYGYPDVTASMIREIYEEWRKGTDKYSLPHDVIGGFAASQFEEVKRLLERMYQEDAEARIPLNRSKPE